MRVRSPLDSIAILTVVCLLSAGVHLTTPQPVGAAVPARGQAAPSAVADAELTRLMVALESQLSGVADPARWAAHARLPLWDFARQIQNRLLAPAQEARVLARLKKIGAAHPGGEAAVAPARHMIGALSVGKTAPDITGTDLDGAPLRLSTYRGQIVALVFTGDWCGVCRSDYPYLRELIDRYDRSPVAVLGVDSGRDRAQARRVKVDQRLTFRAWWDGGGPRHTDGPIATAWNVVGWPTVYVLDPQGVIRFVDVRQDRLIGAVGALVDEELNEKRAPR
jgi:peroxiredoxin